MRVIFSCTNIRQYTTRYCTYGTFQSLEVCLRFNATQMTVIKPLLSWCVLKSGQKNRSDQIRAEHSHGASSSLILHRGRIRSLLNARFLKYTGWVIGHTVCVLSLLSASCWDTHKHARRFPILVSADHKPYSNDYPLVLALRIWHGQKHLLCESQPGIQPRTTIPL